MTARDRTANWGRAAERARVRLPSRAESTPPLASTPSARVRVLYADTDAGGVVYHGSYLRFLEAGRTEALRAVGVSFGRLAEHQLHLPLVEQTVRYRTPAFYDDVLLVYVRTSELRRVQVAFKYEVRREVDEAVVVTGRTLHACIDLSQGRVCPLPSWALGGLRALQTDTAELHT